MRGAWLVAASLLTAILLPISAAVAPSAADAAEGPKVARKSSNLEVRYDPVSDQLSVRADQASLQAVLQEISRIARVNIDAPSEQLPGEKLSVEIKGLSLEQALRQLLQGFNSAFLFSPPAVDWQRGTTPLRLDKVILLSRKTSGSIVGAGAAPLRAATDNNSPKDVQALIETLSDKNSPTPYEAIAALHQVAPEKAVTALANLLRGGDQEMRVIAATGLGQTGNEQAIHPLMSALTGTDPLTRQVAANSLAKIGGQGATDVLFQAYAKGDPALKQAVAGAVAFHADEKSQTALAQVIAGGPVPAGTTSQEVIAGTLPSGEGVASDNVDPGLE